MNQPWYTWINAKTKPVKVNRKNQSAHLQEHIEALKENEQRKGD